MSDSLSTRWAPVDRLAAMPGWLGALDDDTRLQQALASAVPAVRRAELHGLRLKTRTWTGTCTLIFDDPPETRHLAAAVVPPGQIEPAAQPRVGRRLDAGWSCWLPQLRLELRHATSQEAELPALQLLTDAERARVLLEAHLRKSAPPYRNMRIVSVTPHVMRHSPGSRCTILYRLELPDGSHPDWPDTVVAKTYHRPDKGLRAWQGMRALWTSPLADSADASIAEPLAWLPEERVLLQGPVAQDTTLKALLLGTLSPSVQLSVEKLRFFLAKTAVGLVQLHQCGVTGFQRVTWEDELAEVREVMARLTAVLPELEGCASPLLSDLEQRAAHTPAQDSRPCHRSFRPAQVLLHGNNIGFIDFDGFCQAEPALDVALFCATLREITMSALSRESPLDVRLATADELCSYFIGHYEALAPLSRDRVALWEALDLLTNVLHSWTKIKPRRLSDAMALLRHHLVKLGKGTQHGS